jgi:methylated-DNA-[protein]-cysteine S-methyltransferase
MTTAIPAITLHRALVTTPLGDMLALSSAEGLCALEFTGPRKRLTRLDARLARWLPDHAIVDRESPTIRRARAWLKAYFDGDTAEVGDFPLDLRGAAFERRVWTELLRIRPGETMSYGAIARALSTVGASRAVGLANGANPIAIIVPCHRVIGSSGSLTGYGGGLDRKRRLLDLEAGTRALAVLS